MLQNGPQRQGQCCQQQQDDEPPGGAAADPEPVDHPLDKGDHQGLDIAPEGDDHSHQRPQMEHQVKGHRVYVVLFKVQHRLHQGQVARGRNGEKLRQTLDSAQDRCDPKGHDDHLVSKIKNIPDIARKRA